MADYKDADAFFEARFAGEFVKLREMLDGVRYVVLAVIAPNVLTTNSQTATDATRLEAVLQALDAIRKDDAEDDAEVDALRDEIRAALAAK